MNKYLHDPSPKKSSNKELRHWGVTNPPSPPNKIIQRVGVNLDMDAVDNKYSLLLRPRWQTVCRMSISVCPLGMWSADRHSTAAPTEGTAVFIGGQRWVGGARRGRDDEKAPNLHTSISCIGERQWTPNWTEEWTCAWPNLQNILHQIQANVYANAGDHF